MYYKAEHTKRVAGCTTFVASENTTGHNKVAGYISGRYINIWGYMLLKVLKHIPERVVNVNSITIMQDILVITKRTILAN
jgi:hypothetical protein